MLNRTLLENIRYGRPDASDDEVWQAATAAHCRDFIEDLPQGLDTMIGDRGVRLSGGQRQRIAIARAFLKDAPLLILDEATSSLDGESEETIREALEDLMRGSHGDRHRPSPVDLAQLRSHPAAEGPLIEDGAPEALMHRDGPYRALMESELARLQQAA